MRRLNPLTIPLFALLLASACSGDDGATTATTTETSTTTTSGGETEGTSTTTTTSSGGESDTGTTTTTTGETTEVSTTSDTTTTTTGGDPGNNSCLVVLDCADKCGDAGCVEKCIADGSDEGAAEAEAVILCSANNGCGDDEECLGSNCADELLSCTSGDATCAALSDCAEACAGEPLCEANCYAAATTLAQAELNQLAQCIMANGCGDDACVLEKCGPQLGECFSGGADVLECPPLFGCLSECGDDPLCPASCMASGTPGAVTEVTELATCAAANMCEDEACLEEKCGEEWSTCLWGQGNCADGWACGLQCGGGEICLGNCYAMTEENSFPALVGLITCAINNGCTDEECIDANCQDEANACFAP